MEEEEAVEAEEYFDCVGESMKCNTTAILDSTDETDGPPPKPGKGRWHVEWQKGMEGSVKISLKFPRIICKLT